MFFSFWGVSVYDFRCFLIFWGDVLDVSFFCWQEPNEEQTPRTKEIQLFLVEDVQFIFTIDILTIDSGSTLVTFWNWKTSVPIVTYSMVLWELQGAIETWWHAATLLFPWCSSRFGSDFRSSDGDAASGFQEMYKKSPKKLRWQWKINHLERCISYWTWEFSNVMLVFRGVYIKTWFFHFVSSWGKRLLWQ